jgi:hypothetical protein
MIDHPAALNRAMGVLAFLHGVQGELYYQTVEAYCPMDGRPRATSWESVWRFDGNGDGSLFYPGTPARVGGQTELPIASLRLKHLRDGLEDYEYLALAASLGLRPEAEALARGLAPQPFEITVDPVRWEEARERLSDAIERAFSPGSEYRGD